MNSNGHGKKEWRSLKDAPIEDLHEIVDALLLIFTAIAAADTKAKDDAAYREMVKVAVAYGFEFVRHTED